MKSDAARIEIKGCDNGPICEVRWQKLADDLTLIKADIHTVEEKLIGNGRIGLMERMLTTEMECDAVGKRLDKIDFWGRWLVMTVMGFVIVAALSMVMQTKSINQAMANITSQRDAGQGVPVTDSRPR